MRRGMKNLLLLGVIAMGSMMLGMISCSDDDMEKVVFDSQGGSSVNPQYVKYGGKVTKPTDPTTKEGLTFIAWYTTKDVADTVGKQFDFEGAITKDTTLYDFWNIPVAKITLKINGVDRKDTTFDLIGSADRTFQLDTLSVLPANATNKSFTWSSSNEELATVGTDGSVTVNSDVGGIAYIYATANNGSGAKDSYKIFVHHKKEVYTDPKSGRSGKKTYAIRLWDGGPFLG